MVWLSAIYTSYFVMRFCIAISLSEPLKMHHQTTKTQCKIGQSNLTCKRIFTTNRFDRNNQISKSKNLSNLNFGGKPTYAINEVIAL
jgi:hypothetical protein